MERPGNAPPRLTLFGGPVVHGPTEGTVGLTPTHEALLTLIWGHEEQGLSRRRAIWLLWEDDDTTTSRHRLRQVLHEIRRRLRIDPILSSGGDLLEPAWTMLPSDLGEYREALVAGALQRVLALQERGFASRLKKVPSKEFDDWVNAKRARLRRELRETAAGAWDEHQPAGAWRPAREAAEVLYTLDRDSESALRKVVEARSMTGGFEAAEAAYAAYVDRLADDTALEAETRALIDRVRRLAGERELGPPRDNVTPPPLVGRQHDLKAAREVLDRVRSGGFEFLLFEGEGGVGKSRLLDEVRKEAHIKGFRCLQARSVELERRLPLSPLIDALGHPEVARHLRELEDPWRAVILALLPHLPAGMQRPVVPPIAESSLSRRLCDAFSILFTRLAEDEPTLLFLDDLQWTDATTVTVLQFMQRRWRSGSLGVIGTIRPDLVAVSDGVHKYLSGDDYLPVTRLEIEGLDEAEATTLVGLVAEETLKDRVVRRLCALAAGNPFYLIELTKDYLAGRLEMPESTVDALTIPISLRQLVDPRLDALSDQAAHAASILALWGRWARLSDLAALIGTSPRDCLAEVEELERHRLVVVDRDQIRVAHELFRGALYHRLSESRRALLHRTIAHHLLSLDQPQPGELAIHFSRAGDRSSASRFGRDAADAALENGAMAEAAYFLQVVTDNEADERLKAEATADLAKVLHMKRDLARAIPASEVAVVRLQRVGDHAAALRMDIRRLEMLMETGTLPVRNLFERLESIRETASLAQDAEAHALALDSALHLFHLRGRIDEIQSLFEVTRRFANADSAPARCVANASLAMDLLFGDGEDALAHAREAVEIAEREGFADHLLLATERLILVLTYQGMLHSDEGRRLLCTAIRRAETAGDLTRRFSFELSKGVAAMEAGDLDTAQAQFEHVAKVVEHTDPGPPHLLLAYNRAEVSIQQRNFREALEWLATADALSSATTPEYVTTLTTAAAGLCHLELGALAAARECEARLPMNPEHWYFDPTVLLDFQARLLMRRREQRQALRLLQEASEAIEGRLTTAWIKLTLLECRARHRTGLGRCNRVAAAIEVAQGRGLETRLLQLARYRT